MQAREGRRKIQHKFTTSIDMEMDGYALGPRRYLFGISILEERVENINLLQFPFLVERLTGGRGCQSVVGAHFVLRLLRRVR